MAKQCEKRGDPVYFNVGSRRGYNHPIPDSGRISARYLY